LGSEATEALKGCPEGTEGRELFKGRYLEGGGVKQKPLLSTRIAAAFFICLQSTLQKKGKIVFR